MSMLEAKSLVLATGCEDGDDRITLTFEQRHKRRCLMKTDAGHEFLLNFPQPVILKKGDRLQLTNGKQVIIALAEEEVLDIHSENHETLMQIAWTLGNMHCPIEMRPDCIRMPYNHVLEHDLASFGVVLLKHQAPFVPFVSTHTHGHD
jgi:urease accessory protein